MLAGGAAGGLLGNGLNDLLKGFQRNGFGDVADSWVGTGANKEIDPNDLANSIGLEDIDHVAKQSGLSRDQMLAGLSQQCRALSMNSLRTAGFRPRMSFCAGFRVGSQKSPQAWLIRAMTCARMTTEIQILVARVVADRAVHLEVCGAALRIVVNGTRIDEVRLVLRDIGGGSAPSAKCPWPAGRSFHRASQRRAAPGRIRKPARRG